jgi:hypothetical protein
MNNVCYLHHNGFLIFEQRLYILFYFAPLTQSTVSITNTQTGFQKEFFAISVSGTFS